MLVTLLGTGTSTGVPEIGCHCAVCRSDNRKDKRLRASVMVVCEDEVILIDCGPDFRQQMLQHALPMPTALLVTHHHYDHVGGMDDLRPATRHKHVAVYASHACADVLKQHYTYMFEEAKYPGVAQVKLQAMDLSPFYIGKNLIVPIEAYHYKLPVRGYRLGDFAYLTDFSHIDPRELQKLQGVRVLVIEALRHKPHIAHVTLSEAMDLVEQINPEQVYFTHMSHDMGKHDEVNLTLPAGMALGYDGLTFTV